MQTKAARYSHQQVEVLHLLAALLEQERGLTTSILNKAEVDTESFKRAIDRALESMPKVSGASGAPEQIYITARLNHLLALAEDEAIKLKDEYISVEHVLLSMAEDKGTTGRIFKEFGVTRDHLLRALQEV